MSRASFDQGKRSQKRRLARDVAAQASFAMIAVALLLSTTVAGVYVARRELDERARERQEQLLEQMQHVVAEVGRELELCAASGAQSIVSGWAEFPVNDSAVSERYDDHMSAYIAESFPRTQTGFAVAVSNWTGALFFVERKTLDLVPSDQAHKGLIEADGSNMDYDGLPAPTEEVVAERTVSPYYAAVGNFTVEVASGSATLVKDSSFQRPVISALPFIESRLRAFESSSAGEFADLGRLVSYMLSTLAQLRVLEGYGTPAYSGGHDSSEILTERDVYLAVSVGLLLEQVRLFRTFDSAFASEVAAACGGSELGLVALSTSRGKGLDAAELFLWFLGKTQALVDPMAVVAQAIFGMVDQLVIKVMDYLGWLGLLDAAKELVDAVGETVGSVIAYLTGEDKATLAVTSWIRRAITSTGSAPEDVSLFFTSSDEVLVWVPERVYYVEDVYGELHPVWVGNATLSADIPSFNLLSSGVWTELYPEFKACQASFSELATDGIRRLAFDLASAAKLDLGGTTIDPRDDQELLAALAAGADKVTLELNRGAVATAGSKLPMFTAQYELARALKELMDSKGIGAAARAELKAAALSDLSAAVLASARHEYIPGLVVSVQQQLEAIVRHDVEFDSSWGLADSARSSFGRLESAFLTRFVNCVNASVVKADDSFLGPVVDAVAGAIAYGADGFPGLEELLESQLTVLAKQVLAQKRLGAYKRSLHVDLSGEFEFWEGDRGAALGRGSILREGLIIEVPQGLPPVRAVPYDPSVGYGSLESLFPTDSMLVQVRRPWQFDRSASEYPNLHLTSLVNLSATPYATQWTVSALGLVGVGISSNGSALQAIFSNDIPSSFRNVRIELSFPVVVHSSWPLAGVEYNPTNTLVGDAIAAAKRFGELVWDKLEPAFGWIKDGLERLYGFVQRAFETAASFATRMVEIAARTLQNLVETLQEYVQKIANSALARAVDVFIDLFGNVEFRVSLYGFVVIVQTNVPDLLFRKSVDRLRIMVYTDRFGPGITVGVRVAKLGNGGYDLVANGTIALKDATVEVVVDPLMLLMRRFVELHCKARTWGLDLVIPEVEPYELAEVSTADIPGVGAFLSNIPIPVLGLSASVEAGIKLKYSLPFPTDVVINEVESNPKGDDSGHEWVELYNPLDRLRSVDGWRVETSHGKVNSVTLEGAIPPNGLMLVRFPETALDNGFPGDPFNDGDSLVLLDAAGSVLDVTPMLIDTANDARTNQRCWDGGPRWVFKEGSPNDSNGPALLMATSDFMVKALFEAFRLAFEQTKLSEVSASLDFLALFGKRVLHNFIENMLSIVKEIVHEVVFFIEVVVSDASGAAGGGFRTSFVVTGEAIVDLLRWLIHTFATFVVNLGRASTPLAYPPFPTELFSGLYLRFEVLFQVGLPKLVRVIGAVGDLETTYACAVAVYPNIPALGKLAGKDWGGWTVGFGAYLEGVPREFVAGFMSKSSGKYVDFWLVKARLFGM